MKQSSNRKPPRVLLFENYSQKLDARLSIPEDELRHINSVLRLREGDLFEGLDGKGRHAHFRLSFEGKKGFGIFVEALPLPAPLEPQVLPVSLHLGVPKGEAMEWICEKATELGVQEIHPWVTAHTVVDPLGKGAEKFQNRWQTLSDQALKQCGRLHRMTVHPPKKLNSSTAPQRKEGQMGFFFDEIETSVESRERDLLNLLQNSDLKSVTSSLPLQLWVGPEGGWSEEERGFLPRNLKLSRSSLGHLVLRAETAALSALCLSTAALRNRR